MQHIPVGLQVVVVVVLQVRVWVLTEEKVVVDMVEQIRVLQILRVV